MTVELTEEELKLVRMCVDDKGAKMLANYFDPQIQDAGLQNRCKELYTQCTALQKKLEAVYANN